MSHQNFRVLKDTFAPYSNYLPYKKLAVLTRGGRVNFAKMGYLGRFSARQGFWW